MNEEKNEQLTNNVSTVNNQNGNNTQVNMSLNNNIGNMSTNMNLQNNTVMNTNQNISSTSVMNNNVNNTVAQNNTVPTVNSASSIPEHTSSNNDFFFFFDPSKITVGPEAIHPQIPVDNPTTQNIAVDNNNISIEPKKNNTFSLILVFILFVGVGAFIWFMPEIRQMLNHKKPVEEQTTIPVPEEKQEEKTEHFDSMICSQISNTYTIYSQEDKLKKYSTSVEYTKEIDANYQACLTLQQSEVNGFVVGCDKTTNSITIVKTYDFSMLPDTFSNDTLDFRQNDSVKSIKTNLEKQGYTCS